MTVQVITIQVITVQVIAVQVIAIQVIAVQVITVQVIAVQVIAIQVITKSLPFKSALSKSSPFKSLPFKSLPFKSSPFQVITPLFLLFFFSDHILKSHNGIHYHYQEHRQLLYATHNHYAYAGAPAGAVLLAAIWPSNIIHLSSPKWN